LYEVIPAGVKDEFTTSVDALKYQAQLSGDNNNGNGTDEILTIKLRYKEPKGETSKLMIHPVQDEQTSLANTSSNFRFSAAVAAFGMLLRNSAYKEQATYSEVIALAKDAKGKDQYGYRDEFIELVEEAQRLAKK
jgi:Ca-activated chloride channel family protein